MRRLFVAVDLPEALRVGVADFFRDVAAARWANPEQLHLTLRFMGSTSEERFGEIQEGLADVLARPFEAVLRGVGVFPARGPARVLWLGVEPQAPFRALKDAIDERLGPDDEAAGRTFRPHLTVARFHRRPGQDLRRFLTARADFASAPFRVTEFQLYESQLGAGGARHQAVAIYPLRQA